MENLYKETMSSIREKVAMQAIRKVVKFPDGTDQQKLDQICNIITAYMEDKEDGK